MIWHPDVPDMYLDKPEKLETLEKLPEDILNAMTPVEVGEHFQEAANALAQEYIKKTGKKASLEECKQLLTGVLKQTGNSIGGRQGALLVGNSAVYAKKAARLVFPNEFGINEMEY